MYHLPIPTEMHGTQEVRIALRAPTFLPYQHFAGNTDARPLSVMVQRISIR
ncbi:hypothetical protein QTO31_10250 [Chloroflexus sp. MS-CIW-1]|uniref:hypothetical protein n=1 Tax=Chloroflexus sp. MS-CIW-1 TaxID=3055768 RepID=UPI002647C044|nr:hypothetical protein [Chloroflexus sp. MS-CIW-1]MDN5272351.1 hypothetical protein [Chloroflexus sp. MS-CIW-1]